MCGAYSVPCDFLCFVLYWMLLTKHLSLSHYGAYVNSQGTKKSYFCSGYLSHTTSAILNLSLMWPCPSLSEGFQISGERPLTLIPDNASVSKEGGKTVIRGTRDMWRPGRSYISHRLRDSTPVKNIQTKLRTLKSQNYKKVKVHMYSKKLWDWSHTNQTSHRVQ